jgi:hypothetical protein
LPRGSPLRSRPINQPKSGVDAAPPRRSPHAYAQLCLAELDRPTVPGGGWRPWLVDQQTAGYVELKDRYTYGAWAARTTRPPQGAVSLSRTSSHCEGRGP